MPWRHPVGLDALLPSCRACKAAALFVWHRHAGTASTRSAAALLCAFHFAPPRRLALFHGVASPCSPPVRRRRSVSFCRVSSLLFAAAPPSSLHFAPPGPSPLRPIGLSPLRSRGLPPLCPIGLSRFRSTGACLHFAPRTRRRPENSRSAASFSVSRRRVSTKM